MMDFTSRKAEESDLDAILSLFNKSIRETAIKDYSPTQIDAWIGKSDQNKWKARIREQHFLTCETESGMAGFASITNEGYLDLLFVHPDFSGQGIATRLLSMMEAAARDFGCSHIESDVSLTAKGVFLVMGYEVESEQLVSIGAEKLKNFKMVKKL
jgi:GNAT superfamily N-acetyltransferase